MKYAGAAAIPVIAAYVWAYYGRDWHRPMPFLAWVFSHSTDSAFSFNLPRGLALSLLGTLRLFFGGKAAFDALAIAGAAVAAAAFVVLLRAWKPLKLRLERPLLAWVAVYCAFLLVWLPQNTFYRLFYLPPLILIAAGLAPRAAAALATLLFAWNLIFFIRPHARIDSNPALKFALTHPWPPGATIVYGDFHSDLRTIAYFNPQTRWVPVAQWRGGDAWIEGAAAEAHGIPVDRAQNLGYGKVMFFRIQGGRASRPSIREASASPANCSRAASHFSFRPAL